jgi:acetylornithine deacetylase/succinyl-diaminopimelate desuccinylase-like protein
VADQTQVPATVGATRLLQELLRIDTTNPPGGEGPAAELLDAHLSEAGLESRIVKGPAGRPNVVSRIPGPTDRPALVLLSHTDVVGVESERWAHDPFGGEMAEGALWGRGALDMKSICVMHAEAASALAASGATPAREVVVAAVADEEAGGEQGAAWLAKEHAELLGFGEGRPAPEVLGEGAFGLSEVIERPVMPVAFGEKTAVWMDIVATGDPGHGALPPQHQAPEQLARAITAVAGFNHPRVHPVMAAQMRALAPHAGAFRGRLMRTLGGRAGKHVVRALHGAFVRSGPVGTLLADSVTPTQLTAGYKNNVVPGSAQASFDCRLLPDTDVDSFASDIQRRVDPYDVKVHVRRSHGGPVSERTSLFDAIARACSGMSERPLVVPTLSPGFTDLRHLRRMGATGYGWVPLVLPRKLLATIHGHDERVPVAGFEQAVDVMTSLVREVAT